MGGISREIHTFAFAMLGNINTILLVAVTTLIVVAVVVVVAAVVVVAVVIVVVAVTEDVHGTVFMNVVALVETDVVEVVAPAGSAAVLAMANNQDRKVASMAPTTRIEWVKVIALRHSSASGCGGVVTSPSSVPVTETPSSRSTIGPAMARPTERARVTIMVERRMMIVAIRCGTRRSCPGSATGLNYLYLATRKKTNSHIIAKWTWCYLSNFSKHGQIQLNLRSANSRTFIFT